MWNELMSYNLGEKQHLAINKKFLSVIFQKLHLLEIWPVPEWFGKNG